MTEEEWLSCGSCRELLWFYGLRHEKWRSDRAARLLTCAACRLVWDEMTDPRSRAAIEEAERYCDGQTTRKALTAANRAATAAYRETRGTNAHTACWAASKASRPTNPVGTVEDTLGIISGGDDNPWEEPLADMIRDVFGLRLFRPVIFDPSWRTSTVVALANQMYESRDFAPMPVLADALQDAGCDHPDILAHCRDPQPAHVRGCWVVDLILGKE